MKTFIAFLALTFSTLAIAAPKAELWSYWDQHTPQNSNTISHQKWQGFLSRNLISHNEHVLVDYRNVTEDDKQLLNHYVSELASLDPRDYGKQEQYAYWVNLYNALTVKLILDNYPVSSITKLGGFFSFGPWGDEIIAINDKALTLNDIEHRILRPIWQDARTHYAVNCASLGCPNLQHTAFTAENTETLLEQAASQFINSPKGIDVRTNKVVLSSIYEWFAEDFGDENQLLEHLKKHRPTLSFQIDEVRYDYDWALNEVGK